MIKKRFITPEQLYKDAYQLAHMILKSGYVPDVILVMWRGGSPVGIVVQEYLAYHGIKTWHSVIKSESYTGIATRKKPVLENISTTLKKIKSATKVLVVDDIFDTGSTLACLKDQLRNKTENIKTATIYFRKNSPAKDQPDYFLRKTASWIVFPHELIGLSRFEIKRKGINIHYLVGEPA